VGLLDEMANVQVFLPLFQFSIVSITSTKLHNHLKFVHSLIRRTSGRNLGAFTQNALSDIEERPVWGGGRRGGIGQEIAFASFL